MAMLYLECSSGISGDMAAAALLDAGADEAAVRRALASLPVEGFEVRVSRVKKSGLDVCDFDVILDEKHENHDHDMAYLHGHDDAHAHHHDHHGHAGLVGHHHRGPREIYSLIDAADMTQGAKDIARRIFGAIAEAEAQAHGVAVDDVHFHEVGAVDSIADVVAISVALDSLQVDDVVVCELSEGKGTVRCQHGIIPVPVPAVANIVSAHDIPLRILDVEGELVTPTGAAVVAAVRTKAELPARFAIKRVGMGAGKRAYETPGILRVMIIEPIE